MAQFVYGKKQSEAAQVMPEVRLPDVLLFMGDLNYRVNGFKPSIMQAMSQDRYDLLVNCD